MCNKPSVPLAILRKHQNPLLLLLYLYKQFLQLAMKVISFILAIAALIFSRSVPEISILPISPISSIEITVSVSFEVVG